MKEYAGTIGVVAVAIIIALWAVHARIAKTPSGQACTTEVKLCPDGSYVARTGPNCEFAPCPAATTTPPGTSGVRGTISLGPTCPVERVPPDPSCADKPYATAVLVYRAGSTTPLIIGNSDATGAFSLPLAPGSYTLSAGNGTALPRCTPVSVTVIAGAYAAASISCDTGIR